MMTQLSPQDCILAWPTMVCTIRSTGAVCGWRRLDRVQPATIATPTSGLEGVHDAGSSPCQGMYFWPHFDGLKIVETCISCTTNGAGLVAGAGADDYDDTICAVVTGGPCAVHE